MTSAREVIQKVVGRYTDEVLRAFRERLERELANAPAAGGRAVSDRITEAIAKKNWDSDRAWLREHEPWWPMRSWSRAAAWEKRPYLLAAEEGKHPDELTSGAADAA